jgi:hypothetical protein
MARTDGAAVECPECKHTFGGMVECPWCEVKLVPLSDADPTAVAFYTTLGEAEAEGRDGSGS